MTAHEVKLRRLNNLKERKLKEIRAIDARIQRIERTMAAKPAPVAAKPRKAPKKRAAAKPSE